MREAHTYRNKNTPHIGAGIFILNFLPGYFIRGNHDCLAVFPYGKGPAGFFMLFDNFSYGFFHCGHRLIL
jgi:hypothetical protein